MGRPGGQRLASTPWFTLGECRRVAGFFQFYRGRPFASGMPMDPIGKGFISAMEKFAKQRHRPGLQAPP